MQMTVALNNSPYYYVNPLMLRSIGYTIPQTGRIVQHLSDKICIALEDAPSGCAPGLQLGLESDNTIKSRSGVSSLHRTFMDRGILPIIHIPDYIVPGIYNSHGIANSILSLLRGPFHYSKERFSKLLATYLDAAYVLECTKIVMHLPNSKIEDNSIAAEYFSPDILHKTEELGIVIAVENCNNASSPYYGSLDNIIRLVDSLPDSVEMCFDYGHYIVGCNAPVIKDLRKVAEIASVHHVHINDCISDRHLFLGERPKGIDASALEKYESLYCKEVLSRIDAKGKTFVLERNRPYDQRQLSSSIHFLLKKVLHL